MGNRIQKRWPKNAEEARSTSIELVQGALTLIDETRDKLRRREHEAVIALGMADAARALEIVIRLLKEAKNGIEEDTL